MRKLEIQKMMRAKPDPTATIPRTGSWPGNRRGIQHTFVSRMVNRCPHALLKKEKKKTLWKTQKKKKNTAVTSWSSAKLAGCQPQTVLTFLVYNETILETNYTTCSKSRISRNPSPTLNIQRWCSTVLHLWHSEQTMSMHVLDICYVCYMC